ncbi:MAG: hypothetical protein NVS2B7_39560 [Herpetosiphon sp.]
MRHTTVIAVCSFEGLQQYEKILSREAGSRHSHVTDENMV